VSILQETINLVNKLQTIETQARSYPQMKIDKEKAEENVVKLTMAIKDWDRRFNDYEDEIKLWETWLKECEEELKPIKEAKKTKAHIKKILEIIDAAVRPDPKIVAETKRKQNTPK